MSSCGSYSHSYSYHGLCAPSSHASAECQQAYDSYECHKDSYSCSYRTHHDCHQPPPTVDVLTLANQLAASMGAGVQGTIGCTVDPDPAVIAGLTPTDPDGLLNLGNVSGTTHVLGNADSDNIKVGLGDGNTLVVGDGATDQIFVNTGDDNVLWAGNGDGDMLTVSTGDNNALHAGSGNGDQVIVFTGDDNCLTVGDGSGEFLGVGTGGSNELTAGDGANDIINIDTGDNNLMTAGDGDTDSMAVGTGDHNSLIVGNGAGDMLLVNTGDYNFLHAGNGAGDQLVVSDGDFNALIAGHGNGDQVILGQGNNNVLAQGDGNNDILQLGDGGLTSGTTMGQTGGGDNNILLQGNGANDFIFLGGANFDSVSGGHLGRQANSGNVVIMGNGDGDQAWGSIGDHNSYLTGAGNDLVHTGGGNDFVYVDNHTETSDPQDPFHLTTTDSLAQNLFADGGHDTFAIQGAQINASHYCGSYTVGHCYSDAISFHTQSYGCDSNGSVTPLGTTVMTGGGGVENYWVAGAFGNAVVTDFNSANGDRVMVGGVWDGANSTLSSLGPIHTQYIHSAYDTANTGNVDLLITFGSNSATQGSITLIDFLPQDTGGAGGAEQFNNVTFNNPVAAESTLAHVFDFSQADNQAVTNQVASLAAANLILH
jgi:Ca2+-binding RTX toxin-like protein